MKSITFISEAGDSSCTKARAKLPAQGLRQLGYEVYVDDSIVWHKDHRGWRMKGFHSNKVTDIIIIRKIGNPWDINKDMDMVDEIMGAKQAGQKVFYEMDDDRWNLPLYNPASRYATEQNLVTCGAICEAVDGVIVSTRALKTSVLENVKYPAPVHICHNGVDVSEYQPHREHEPIRVVWCGATDFRGKDFMEIKDMVNEAIAKYPIEFWHFGANEKLDSIQSLLWNFSDKIKTAPWCSGRDFPIQLAEADIVLIPMLRNKFNDARSNVTGLQCAAAGIPFIATNTFEYEKLALEGVGIASPTEQFGAVLEELLTMGKWRRILAIDGRRNVQRLYSPKVIAHEWLRALHA